MNKSLNKNEESFKEIDLIYLIKKIFQSKLLLTLSIIIFMASSYIYSFQKGSTYESKALIEIGHYESEDGTYKLFSDAPALIKELRIFLYKNNENLIINDDSFRLIEDRLIEIKFESISNEANVALLNQCIDFLKKNSGSEIFKAQRNNLINEIDSTIRKIDFLKDKNAKFAKTLEESILTLDELISDEENKLKLITDSPDASSEIVALTKLLIDLKKDKLAAIENQGDLSTFYEIYELDEEKLRLQEELKKLDKQNIINTEVIGQIKTSVISHSLVLILTIGLALGIVSTVFIVFLLDFIKIYKQREI